MTSTTNTNHGHPVGAASPMNRERGFRLLLLVTLCVVIILLLHLTATTSLSRSQLVRAPPPVPCAVSVGGGGDPDANGFQGILNETRLRQITDENRNLVYLHPPIDMVMMTMAKAGTSTTWHWLYPGVTGRPKWDIPKCRSYVHEIRSACWKGFASYVYTLPIHQQWDILSSRTDLLNRDRAVSNNASDDDAAADDVSANAANRTLRVAIQRNPYERVISSFKSKFTCEAERFGTDVHNRRTMVPVLRRRCGMPTPPASSEFATCMNISEFASTLERCRLKKDFDLDVLDVHIKPQQFFFNEIDYDMVIDVNDLSDINVLRPIIDRIPRENRHLVEKGPRLRHSSGSDQLEIPEQAARLLYSYALESVPGRLKYVDGAEPSANKAF